MPSLKRIAPTISIVSSILAIYAYFPGYADGLDLYLLYSGILLLIVSLLCLYGIYYAFFGSSLFSLISLILSLSTMLFSAYLIFLDFLLLASIILNILTIRRWSKIPEQAHPLNLPVFG